LTCRHRMRSGIDGPKPSSRPQDCQVRLATDAARGGLGLPTGGQVPHVHLDPGVAPLVGVSTPLLQRSGSASVSGEDLTVNESRREA
jgi:hypothetical protein